MTKPEFIARALDGNAEILRAPPIDRYCITNNSCDADRFPDEYAAIFISINTKDGSVYDADAPYFTDGLEMVWLDRREAEKLRALVEREMARR